MRKFLKCRRNVVVQTFVQKNMLFVKRSARLEIEIEVKGFFTYMLILFGNYFEMDEKERNFENHFELLNLTR